MTQHDFNVQSITQAFAVFIYLSCLVRLYQNFKNKLLARLTCIYFPLYYRKKETYPYLEN